MFKRHDLDTLFYPILPNDFQLYEVKLQINIIVFSVDDEYRARHPLMIRGKNYERVGNLLYLCETVTIRCIEEYATKYVYLINYNI